MTLVGVSQIIPSGKVYRQIFDDEVQLVRALGEARSKISQHKAPPSAGKIPLVKDAETCSGTRFLSHRQQTWVEGMPNDEVTENPVLYKEATILEHQKAKESENVIAAREVRGLADVIIPVKKNSDIIERISENRRCRHENATETLRQELARVGKELERFVLEPTRLFVAKLSESDQIIETLFIQAQDDSDLETRTIHDFEEVWAFVTQQTLQRRQWIRELDKELQKAERYRTELIKVLLKKYTKILEDSAYLLTADTHRFIHNEAMMINQALLANRRAIGRLFVNLMEADLKREVVQRNKLEERIRVWRAVQKDATISNFRKYMESEEVQNPRAVRTEMQNMLKEQLSLSEQRRELLYSLRHFLPLSPSKASKAEINEWNASLMDLNKRIDTSNVQYMMRIRIQYEVVCQECLAKVQECKQKLMEMKICTEKEAENVVNPNFFQLVGKLQSRFENEVERMDDDFEQLVKHTEVNCRYVYQYFQDALLLFDKHQQKLAQQENDLHHKMNECRNKHEALNKLRESNLDASVDKLRIQCTEEKLKAQLEKVYTTLEYIRTGYDTFHQDLMGRVTVYPELILHELVFYSIGVSRYFYVKQVYKGKLFAKASVVFETDLPEEAEELEEEEESLEGGSEEGELPPQEERTSEEEVGESAEELEQAAKLRETGSFGSDITALTAEETSLVLESDEVDRFEKGSSIVPEVEGTSEAEEATLETPRASATLSGTPGAAVEFFSTLSGNTYKAATRVRKSKSKKSERYFAGNLNEDVLPPYLEQVYLSQWFFTDLRRQIRQQFFEHLERWFDQTLSRAWIIVAAEKEELASELRLRVHLHEPRRERIERDVYRVRMAELKLHNERLVRHCAGVVQALHKEKESFFKLREDQNSISSAFQQRIHDMENVFLMASRAEKLQSLSNNLHGELINHMEVMQVSLRSYRQYMEESLGKLRDANTDYLKACKLFSDGGNFSTEEVEHLMKRLEKESERIDFVEGLIMIDLEKMESTYLEQATEVVNKFESRFRYLALDRVFMEKLQRFLTNIQVKIKAEVAKSNFQTKTLNSHLERLVGKIDACAYPNVDKESITPEELFEFAMFVIEELKKRTGYLDCLLALLPAQDMAFSVAEAQESPGTASLVLSDSFLQEPKVIVMGMENAPILNPSRMGKPLFDDPALGVIKNLLGVLRYRKMLEAQTDQADAFLTPGALDPLLISPPADSAQGTGPHSTTAPSAKVSSLVLKGLSGSAASIQRYIKLTRVEKKTQILGDRMKDSDNFRGIIFGIVWESFDLLMNVAEDFYKRDKHQITRPEFLQDTYDACIESMGQKLLLYVTQADDYHVACISEFREQLKRFEGLLPDIAKLVIDKLHKDYEQLLTDSMGQIRHSLQEQLRIWELAKDQNKHCLSPSLGHPDNIPQLEALCQVEEERQKEQAEGVCQSTQKLEACLVDCTQRFVSALASCTETVLLRLDECLTVDDVQMGKIETPREKISTLIRRRKAGLSLEVEAGKLVAERGSRTWPGIPRTTLTGLPNQLICRETASVTTTKTTLGHVAAVEERDAVYVKFKQVIEAEVAKITEESTVHLMKAQHWAVWWRKSVQKIKQLYA